MTRQSRDDQSRPKRISVNQQRDRLSVRGLDTNNFYYRWFNDFEGRIENALQAGYVFVEKSEIQSSGDPTVDTSRGTDSRIRKGVGGGKVAYLMKLPIEYKKEYDAEKEAEILETERAMQRLKHKDGHPAAQDADYGTITISRK